MSAFIVSDDTFNSIVSHFESKANRGSGIPGEVSDLLKSGKTERSGRLALCHALWAMNAAAVNARYPGDKVSDAPVISRSVPAPSLVRAYKHIRCYLYQCSEGDVPESSLYKALDAYSLELAAEIVQTLPEYDRAPWG